MVISPIVRDGWAFALCNWFWLLSVHNIVFETPDKQSGFEVPRDSTLVCAVICVRSNHADCRDKRISRFDRTAVLQTLNISRHWQREKSPLSIIFPHSAGKKFVTAWCRQTSSRTSDNTRKKINLHLRDSPQEIPANRCFPLLAGKALITHSSWKPPLSAGTTVSKSVFVDWTVTIDRSRAGANQPAAHLQFACQPQPH